jgi:hypothetical protein
MYVHLSFDGIFELAENPLAANSSCPDRQTPGIVRRVAGPE